MENKHICPWWMGYFLINPFRRFIQNPQEILSPHLNSGMTVIDYGSAMGYFSLPMAKMVGSHGKVICFDIQEKMLAKLISRAEKSNLQKIIEARIILKENVYNDLREKADFALLFAVAHEVPNRQELFDNLAFMLKPDASLLFSEPKGHVSTDDFFHLS